MPEVMQKNRKKAALIIHPPLTKPCEPPAALAYLAGALEQHAIPCEIFDCNIGGIHSLLSQKHECEDTWSKRAVKNIARNLQALKEATTYENRDRYHRAVADVNRVLEIAGRRKNLVVSLGNYQDNRLSPLKSQDLCRAAEHFQENIFFPYFSEKTQELVLEKDPEYVGLSINYLSQALCSFAIIGYLRSEFPTIKIIVGGGLITTWLSTPEWSDPFEELIDLYISGKGETQLLTLLGRTDEQTHYLPQYHKLRGNPYLSPGFILPYTSSRGCYWKKCTFCPETSENNPYHHLHPDQSVAELATLAAANRPSLIHLLDNALSPSTLKAISQTESGPPWYGFARFDPLLEDKDFCKRLKASGCVMLKLGLESGDQKVLDEMKKGIHLQKVEQVFANLHDVGIATYVYLLFGTPAEDYESAEKTLFFVAQHHYAIDFLNVAIFNLPRHSHENINLDVADFYEGDLSIYHNFIHPKGWNRREIRRFLDTRFKNHPHIGSIIKRDPPFFTSNHAAFFVNDHP